MQMVHFGMRGSRRRFKKRRGGKRRVVRRRRFGGRRLLSRGLGDRGLKTAMPGQSKVVRMRYCAFDSWEPAVGGNISASVYRANDILDPPGSSTTHQAFGYDQWSAFYQTWTVLGSKITVSPGIAGGTAQPGVVWGIRLQSNDTVPAAQGPRIIESGRSPWAVQPSITNGMVSRYITSTFSLKKWKGFRNVRDCLDETNSGSFASGGIAPTEPVYFMVWYGSIDPGVGDAPQFRAVVQIDYIVLLTNPAELAVS